MVFTLEWTKACPYAETLVIRTELDKTDISASDKGLYKHWEESCIKISKESKYWFRYKNNIIGELTRPQFI